MDCHVHSAHSKLTWHVTFELQMYLLCVPNHARAGSTLPNTKISDLSILHLHLFYSSNKKWEWLRSQANNPVNGIFWCNRGIISDIYQIKSTEESSRLASALSRSIPWSSLDLSAPLDTRDFRLQPGSRHSMTSR